MTLFQVEQRLAQLEKEVEILKLQSNVRSGRWYVEHAGQFADDPVYAEIARRGQAYRKSLRPKPRAKRRRG